MPASSSGLPETRALELGPGIAGSPGSTRPLWSYSSGASKGFPGRREPASSSGLRAHYSTSWALVFLESPGSARPSRSISSGASLVWSSTSRAGLELRAPGPAPGPESSRAPPRIRSGGISSGAALVCSNSSRAGLEWARSWGPASSKAPPGKLPCPRELRGSRPDRPGSSRPGPGGLAAPAVT